MAIEQKWDVDRVETTNQKISELKARLIKPSPRDMLRRLDFEAPKASSISQSRYPWISTAYNCGIYIIYIYIPSSL